MQRLLALAADASWLRKDGRLSKKAVICVNTLSMDCRWDERFNCRFFRSTYVWSLKQLLSWLVYYRYPSTSRVQFNSLGLPFGASVLRSRLHLWIHIGLPERNWWLDYRCGSSRSGRDQRTSVLAHDLWKLRDAFFCVVSVVSDLVSVFYEVNRTGVHERWAWSWFVSRRVSSDCNYFTYTGGCHLLSLNLSCCEELTLRLDLLWLCEVCCGSHICCCCLCSNWAFMSVCNSSGDVESDFLLDCTSVQQTFGLSNIGNKPFADRNSPATKRRRKS